MRRGVSHGGLRIPTQVADRLAGRGFASFAAIREATRKKVAADPEFAAQFDTAIMYAVAAVVSATGPIFLLVLLF